MQFIKRRQNDPQYLKNVIDQKLIIIEQEQRKYQSLAKQNDELKLRINELQNQITTESTAFRNQILNLNLAIKQQQSQLEAMKHDKSQYQFKVNMLKLQIKQQQKQHKFAVQKMKIDFQGQKQTLNIKINKLQKNISALSSHYNIHSQIHNDKLKIIQDSNRDLRGFSNQKQQRMIMIQNQQYANQIQYQAKQIQNLLAKNQKLIQQIKNQKSDLQLHKQIQNDLVKRSSLAQTLIRQLNKKLKQMEDKSVSNTTQSAYRSRIPSHQSSRVSTSKVSIQRQKVLEQELNKLRFNFANQKNHTLYLQNMQKIYTQKYQTLAAIMAQYLQNILYFKQKRQKSADQTFQAVKQVNLDLAQLKNKDVKQWKTEEIQTILFLLINQVKPFLSKNSLINFPQMKNISITFTQNQNKQGVSLPKISQNYKKTYQKQVNKITNRFKDIPLDISTKILRSDLRQWGTKVSYGSNVPSTSKLRKLKSKSIASDIDRTSFI